MRVTKFALIILFFSSMNVFSQGRFTDEIELILSEYKNFRYGSVGVYEVLETAEIKEILDSKKAAATGGVSKEEAEKVLQSIEPNILKKIEDGVNLNLSPDEINLEIIKSGLTPPAIDDLKSAYQYYYDRLMNDQNETILRVYIVSTLPKKIGENPNEIIGAIMIENDFVDDTEKLKVNMKKESKEVYSYRKLRDEDINTTTYGYDNMYDLLYSYFIQGNVRNKSMEAKGIGTDETLFVKKFGVADPLVDYNRYNGTLRSTEINSFMRISKQEPIDYRAKYQILSVSPDNISWTKYDKKYVMSRGKQRLDSLGNPILDLRSASNSDLPNFGFELDYGAEDVNFPSFWSERLTASAFWRNVKFGLILPTNGWSSLSSDVLDQGRSLTHGGFGVAGQLDFPIAVIQRSELFQLSFGYVFGDAQEASYNEDARNYDVVAGILPNASQPNDYLLRTNASLMYTFGMSIDQDYLLRFGIGGSFYNMETWRYSTEFDQDLTPVDVAYGNVESESIGGVALKLDFLAKNDRTPFGTTLNFFDEVLYVDAFVQIPVIENSFSIKVNAKGNYITRGTLRAWEEAIGRGFFQPNVSLIYAF